MKANELMIGDLVKISKGNWSENRQVGLIDIEMIAESVYLADPIPLTAEILEKNGWENSAPDVWQKEYGGLVFYWENGTRRFGMNDFRHLQEQWEIHLRIMHTHELQHALRLCGIEHEITL